MEHRADIFKGLLGGYCVHDHAACTRLFSLEKVVQTTLAMQRAQLLAEMRLPPHVFVVAGSYDMQKCFFCDAATLEITMAAPVERRVFPAHNGSEAQPPGDGLLRWLEEYSQRLESRYYTVSELVPGNRLSRGISLIPAAGTGPHRCVLVHRGIELSGGATFSPELGRWIYSISIRQLGEGTEGAMSAAARGFVDCQLRLAWFEVRGRPGDDPQMPAPRPAAGAGVHGRCPLLLADGKWRDDVIDTTIVQRLDGRLDAAALGRNLRLLGASLRQGPVRDGAFTFTEAVSSAADVDRGMESVHAGFTFVPGSLRNPTGEQFEVEVGPINTCVDVDSRECRYVY